jgi:hypothetical protein
LCLYYVDDPLHHPQTIRARMGSVFYVPQKRGRVHVIPPSKRRELESGTNDAAAASSSPSAASSSSSPSARAPLSASECASVGWNVLVVTLSLANLPMQGQGGGPGAGAYRFVYFDSTRQRNLAASDVFIIKPSAGAAAAAAKAGEARLGTAAAPYVAPSVRAPAPPSSSSVVPGSAPVTTAAAVGADTSASPASNPSSAPSKSSGGIFSFLPSTLNPLSWGHRGSSQGLPAATTSSAPQPARAASASPSAAAAAAAALAAASIPGTSLAPPVALHPSFALLSVASPERLASYLTVPPPYFRSHFHLNHAAVGLALHLDPNLDEFSRRFTAGPDGSGPGIMTPAEFWLRYFFLMSRLDDNHEAMAGHHVHNARTGSQVLNAAAAQNPPEQPHSSDSVTSSPARSSTSSPVPAMTASEVVSTGGPQASTSSVATATATTQAHAGTPPLHPVRPAPAASPARAPVAAATVPAASTRVRSSGEDDDEDADSSYVPPSFAAMPAQPAQTQQDPAPSGRG